MGSETGAGPHGDRVERTIEIDADAGRVWELVSEPGWFVNDGTIRAHTVERDGDVSTVHDDVHGTLCIRTVHLEAARTHLTGGAASSPDPASQP